MLFHLSLCFNEPIKQKPPIPPSLVEKCIRTDANLGKIGWNCCTASRGGGCSPCLLGGGLEWKEFEKAPQIDSKIGIVDNLRIWSHTTKLFKCLWIHGEKTCEMKFSWLRSPKPTRTQRFQIQSQNSTFKKPTTKPTKTTICAKKKWSPLFAESSCMTSCSGPAQVTEILRHEHFLAQLHRARFEKLLQRCPYLAAAFCCKQTGDWFFIGTKLPCFVGWLTWFGVQFRMFSTLMSWKRIHVF